MAGQNLIQGQQLSQKLNQKNEMKDSRRSSFPEAAQEVGAESWRELSKVSELSYHELDTQPVQQMNPLDQLEKNLNQLSNASAKLKFMMREIRYIMKV